MKNRKTLIAAAATMVLGCGQMALAAQHLHEDQWDKVNLYGSTTIAGDSVDDWGPWKEFVQPAAGAPTVALLGALGGEAFRPLVPTVPTANDVCKAGDMCGYAVFGNYASNYNNSEESDTKNWKGNFPAAFGLSVLKTGPSTSDGDDSVSTTTPISGSWRVAPLFGETAPAHDASGELTGTLDDDPNYIRYLSMFRSTQLSDSYGEADVQGVASNYYSSRDIYLGWFGRYINGAKSGVDGGEGETRIDGFFVAGYTTPLADMAALQAGNVQAAYLGNNIGWWGGVSPSRVSLSVNFGNSTWNGSWNGGKDGSNVYTQPDSSGRLNLYGQVGFNVTGGTVSGANFSASTANLSATDGTVSGNVQGSFYGALANMAAGVVAINKTVAAAPAVETLARVAAPVGYTNGKLTDVFVAFKNTVITSTNAPR